MSLPARNVRTQWVIAIASVVLLVAACGNEEASPLPRELLVRTDISGWFDDVTEAWGECDQTAVQNRPAIVLWVEKADAARFNVHYCDGPTEVQCYASFPDFNEPIAHGWASGEGSAQYGYGGCSMSWTRSETTVIDSRLLMRRRTFSREFAAGELDAEACTMTTAATLREPCTDEFQLTATRM